MKKIHRVEFDHEVVRQWELRLHKVKILLLKVLFYNEITAN